MSSRRSSSLWDRVVVLERPRVKRGTIATMSTHGMAALALGLALAALIIVIVVLT